MIKDPIDRIEDLLDDYVYAYDDYKRSQTCDSNTYKKQEQAMYSAKYELLSEITKQINGV